MTSNLIKVGNEYFLSDTGEKAKWYHMVLWERCPETWKILPTELKQKIIESGVEVPE